MPLGVVAERGRERDFVTAGVALESVSDNVQLLAAPVAESLKHFEHRGGRTAWARVRDRLAALSIEINTRVVRVTSPAARDRASTEDTGQHAAHRTHGWPVPSVLARSRAAGDVTLTTRVL